MYKKAFPLRGRRKEHILLLLTAVAGVRTACTAAFAYAVFTDTRSRASHKKYDDSEYNCCRNNTH